MSDYLITRMKAAAERAEHGEFWQVASPCDAPASTTDAIHIALSHPGNVLTLIARIEALQAENARLSARVAELEGEAVASVDAINEAVTRLEATEAERDTANARLQRAVEALRPFATMAALVDRYQSRGVVCTLNDKPYQGGAAWQDKNGNTRTVTYGDFRNARATLTDLEKADER